MDNNRYYYTAYEERYKAAHKKGVSWASDVSTPIVLETIRKYRIQPGNSLLEIGCGEGRDAKSVLESGYCLAATDISPEAIAYCRKMMPEQESCFRVMDFLSDDPEEKYDFIYAVAVVHMLVLDEDRNGFYRFIYDHLARGGLALICTMGDGTFEMRSNIDQAFDIQERDHVSGKLMVTATSCRMVSFRTFENELTENRLEIIERGITSALPEFDSLMYAVVKRKNTSDN